MDIELHIMSIDEKSLLVRLMELYNYEFSQYSGDDINEFGYYGYEHIDDYWNEKGRYPYLIRADGKIAGFALICPHCDFRDEDEARCIGEFFVMLKYRRLGIGTKAAAMLFDKHPGIWEVTYWKNNIPAGKFWKEVISSYTGGDFRVCGDDKQTGLLFENT